VTTYVSNFFNLVLIFLSDRCLRRAPGCNSSHSVQTSIDSHHLVIFICMIPIY